MKDLTFTEVSEILAVIEKTECSQLTLEYGDLLISVTRGSPGAGAVWSKLLEEAPAGNTPNGSHPTTQEKTPAHAVSAPGGVALQHSEAATRPASATHPESPEATPAVTSPDVPEQHWLPVRSPTVGTFYRAPAPGEPPFVNEGDHVEAGQAIGVVEVMKLFSNVTADVSGIIVRLPVADGQMVEHDQSLAWIEPVS
ncbi:acetyl-CoA carboxylase biotin carboxyl carrier protein [Rhodococcus opacus]|uniref:acetyl-CoA carboxylase biotin carboxyl carrier protein n=1 Tax=Rhodococcus opacus TaxID=37919 RepID=UPI002949B485|nr:biotin/lipoyl-containing protein [Rhodococcus opacus]MDV6247082.1 biotin/lipoyl-containing protein [Rhodococcus opacus]